MTDAKACKSPVEGRLEDDLRADGTPATVTLPTLMHQGKKNTAINFIFPAAALCFIRIKTKCLCTMYTLMQIHPHGGVFEVRVLYRVKNGNCISLADLGLGAKSLKLQMVSHI